MPQINLTTTGSFALLILLLAAAAFSYFVYRRTTPPVSNRLRFLLMTLRALSAMLLVLLLFEPILSLTRKKADKPVVAVLIDQSASMGLVDQSDTLPVRRGGSASRTQARLRGQAGDPLRGKVDRRQVLQSLLQSDVFRRRSDEYEMVFYPFAAQLQEGTSSPPDTLHADGDGTDIRGALDELKKKLTDRYFAAVVLLSDGANNLGENPARYASEYGVPIHAVGIGDPSEQRDVLISNFVTNEIAYAGAQIPVEVYIKSSGFEGRRLPVNLTQGNRTLDSKVVELSGGGLEQRVRLLFTPEQEGLFKYEIKLPKLEGELTDVNNTRPFYVKVLKSKLDVLMVAGGPSADFNFLKRSLAADQNVAVQAFVEKDGQFYGRASMPTAEELAKSDAVILLDFPRRTSAPESITRIKSLLAAGKPLFLIFGKNVDLDKLWQLSDFLPFSAKPAKGSERVVYAAVLPQGMHHPIFRLSEDEVENRERWLELPPIFTILNYAPLHPSAQSLAASDVNRSPDARRQSLPIIVCQTSGKRKSATVLAYGLWRWDLLMTGVGKSSEAYHRFLQNTIRWLVSQEDSKPVRIAANKEVYRSGEKVKFTAQVYFEDFQPVDGAEVVVQVRDVNETFELSLKGIGGGRYEGSLEVLQGGDYEFTGSAHLQGRVLGRDQGKFSVEEFNLEFQDTRMNEELLRRIAEESGGAYFTPEEVSRLSERLQFNEKFVVIKNEWEIWNKTPLLITCILLLSAEWLIRKRKGML